MYWEMYNISADKDVVYMPILILLKTSFVDLTIHQYFGHKLMLFTEHAILILCAEMFTAYLDVTCLSVLSADYFIYSGELPVER